MNGLMGPKIPPQTNKPVIDAPSCVKTAQDLQELTAWMRHILAMAREQWEKEARPLDTPTGAT